MELPNPTALQSRPKVALALSGASSRSIFYIGFLEVLQENNFPIDYIAAMSGAAIVACSYSCGTMQQLKATALQFDTEFFYNLVQRSRGSGGLYHLEKVEELVRVYTKNMKFEDVYPKLGFVATDIHAGDEVVLQVGDIAKAVCASCTLPGVFEPVQWGSKALVDGGILNIVPGNVAQAANADLVIGIDLRATRHVFSRWQIYGKRVLNRIKRIVWPTAAGLLWQRISNSLDTADFFNMYPEIDENLNPQQRQPNMFSVLGRSLDLAIKAQESSKNETNFNCDVLIVPEAALQPKWKKYFFLHFTDFSRTYEYYQLGRKTAEEQLPMLWQKLADTEVAMQNTTTTVSKLLTDQEHVNKS